MRIGNLNNFKIKIGFAARKKAAGKNNRNSTLKHCFRQQSFAGLLLFCILLQPNLLVMAAVRNSENNEFPSRARTPKQSENQAAKNSDLPANGPRVKEKVESKPINLFRARNGLSKAAASEQKIKFEENIKNTARAEKARISSANEDKALTENEIAPPGQEETSGFSLGKMWESFFGWFQSGERDDLPAETAVNAQPLPVVTVQNSAIVRHGFNLDGRIEGSIQQLLGEGTILNSGSVITQDLLVPGVPNLVRNGTQTFGGVVTGTGSATPTNYQIILNANTQLRNLITRTNPIAMPAVSAPPASTGTQSVTVNSAAQMPTNFANINDLTLNSNVGTANVTPGTYRNFMVNSGSGLRLGVSGATQPVTYNFQALTLNSGGQIQIISPVVINLNSGVSFNSAVNSAGKESWLKINIASGGLTLNTGSSLYGSVNAPNGTVMINASTVLVGGVACDRLTVNSGGILRLLPIESSPSISVAIASPANNFSTSASSISVSGTAQSGIGVANIFVNNQPAAYNSANGTWTIQNVPLAIGANTVTARAVDMQGAEVSAQISVTRTELAPDTTPAVLAITMPSNNSTTQAETITVSGTVSDSGANASGVASVTVNGVAATRNVAAGTWTLSSVGLNLGQNSISVRAVDNAGNVSTAVVIVTREPSVPPDTTAPLISIISPENSAVVYTPTVTVTGTAQDPGANPTGVKQIRVNGHAASYNPGNQTWSVENFSLNEGENTIVAEVEDNAQPTPNVGRAQIKISRRSVQAPTISVTSPANGAVVASNNITVAGKVGSNAPNIPLSVKINGQSANLAGDEFTKLVPLAPGVNSIVAQVENSFGQSSQTSITVISDMQNPTVALQNAPASVRPLLSYQITAEAADNQALQSIEFVVNGQLAARLENAPYQFTLQIPGDATPGNVYNISAIARDAAGNTAVDTAQAIIAGPSGVSGYVFDDKTGYSVQNADARLLDPQTSAVTDESGAYNLVSSSSFGTVRITKNGYTSVERSFTANSGTGLNLFDARLTPIDEQANVIGTAGGTATGDGGRIRAVFAANGLTGGTDIRATVVSPQGIANLLPYGWSPIPGAVVDIRAANSTASITQNLAAPAQLTVSQIPHLSSGLSLVLARYDEYRHNWQVLGINITAGENGTLAANLPALGQYAFLVPDAGTTVPPQAVVGKELPSSGEASDAALNAAQVTAAANPRSSLASPNAKSTITVTADAPTKLPSGVAIEAAFDETYRLLGEPNALVIDRLPQDFVLYSFPFATTEKQRLLGASFVAKPTRPDLTTAQLQFGNVHIAIHAGRGDETGVLIGTQGGEVSSADGANLQIAANSLAQNTSVFLDSVDTRLSGIALPEGFEIISAVDLNLSGANLAQSGRLSVPVAAGDNSRVILARIVTAGSLRGLKVVARAVEENNRIVSTVSGSSVPAGASLSGVRVGGRYAFVRIPEPFGYGAGTVKNSSNALTANARVTADLMPFIDLTGPDGKFLVLTKAGAGSTNNLDAVLLGNDATGNAQISTVTQDAIGIAEIRLASSALAVTSVSPNNNSANVLVSSPIIVTFNKPVNPLSVTGSSFKIATETGGNPVLGKITLAAGNRAATFTPNGNLSSATRYRIQITTAIKDIYGATLASEFVAGFTTSQIVTVENRLKPEKIRIAYPNEQGLSTITLPAGSVPAGSTITVINNNTGSTVSTVTGAGETVIQIAAQVGEEIILTVRQPDGTIYQVKQAAYRRADGFTSVGSNGGTITSDDGQIVLAIPQGAIEGQANIKMSAAAESQIPIAREGEMNPNDMKFAAGTKLEVNGSFTQKEELHLEVPAPANLQEGQRAVFMQPSKMSENGVERDAWKVVTTGTVNGGKIKTTSPPFQGVNVVDANLTLISYSIFFFTFIPIRLKAVVGKVTEQKTVTVNGTQLTKIEPVKNAIVILPPTGTQPATMFCPTNARGEFGILVTSATSPAKIRVNAPGHPVTDVDTFPYQSTSTEWLLALLGFESRYAAVEFPDPLGDPRNRPALIQIEGATQGFEEANDPLRLYGKVPGNATVNLRIKTTPDVETATGTIRINGANPASLTLTRSTNQNEFTTSVPVGATGAYNVAVETFTTRNQPLSKAVSTFNFIAVSDPNNDCGIGNNSSPVVLQGWTPKNGATNVDAGTKINLNFSEKVKNLIAGQNLYLLEEGSAEKIGGTLTSGVVNVLPATEVCKVEFRPARGLTAGKKYTIRAESAIKDAENNTLTDFSSEFTTFKPLILNDPAAIPTSAYKIASAGDYMSAIEMSYPTGRLKVYDISEPESPREHDVVSISQIPVALDMISYEKGQGIQLTDGARVWSYDNIIAVATTSHPNTTVPNNVWFYAVLDEANPNRQEGQKPTLRSPVRLIGVVSLNSPNSAPEFPGSIKILGKRAYVGSTSSGGFWAIDIQGAAEQLFEDGNDAWFPAVYPPGRIGNNGYATDRIRQKVPNAVKDIMMRNPAISGIQQAVDNDSVPVIYPLPYFTGQPSKATAFNLKSQFDNRMAFFDTNGDNLDDRVLSQKDFAPSLFPIDVKSQARVALSGSNSDLTIYLTSTLFWIFNVNNPKNPTQYNAVNFSDFGLTGEAKSLEFEDHFVYVLFSDKIAVFDIKNPDQPYLSSVISGVGTDLSRFTVKNGFVYSLSNSTGIRVSTGRPFANIIVRGFDESNPEEFCVNPILVKKVESGATRMLQDAEIRFKVYGHEAPLSAKVRIRKEKVVDGNNEVSIVKEISVQTKITGTQNVIEGTGYWLGVDAGEIDLDASYSSQIVLDQGAPSEFVSTLQPVPFSTLISNAAKRFEIKYDKDKQNASGFEKEILGKLPFLLGARATVALSINGQFISQIYPAGDSKGEINNNYTKGFGGNIYYIGKKSFPNFSIFPNGTYAYQLTAKYLKSSGEILETQVEQGTVVITNSSSEIREPGSEMVNGVELKTGNLALSYQDVTIPNRGLSLNLTRSYNSAGANAFSSFGYGWTHSYNIQLAYNDEEKEYKLLTGEGGLQTFKVPANGDQNNLKAEKPNQTSLVKNADGTIDVVTKGQTKYHFNSISKVVYIEEPNKNRLTFAYDTNNNLSKVTDSSGRSLIFTYEQTEAALIDGFTAEEGAVDCARRNGFKITRQKFLQAVANKAWRITSVKAPGGLYFTYDYDNPTGNLVSVTKHSVEEAPDLGSLPAAKDAVWKYGYEQNTATNKSLSHLLKTVQTPNHTETESHITTYEYDQAKVDLPIIKITFPESVTNAFGYTKEGDLRRRTKVKDGNGKETEYIFDSRPQDSLEPSETTINAPLGATTVIRWNNYGQKKKETDPEGRTTEFWYDDRQNPTITETKDAGGTTLYFTSTHYDQKFNKPDQVSVKRSAAETLTTTYTIDQNTGNVRRIALPNGGIIEMDYYANGDLMWQKDQFGTRTDFSNYEYGFPKTVKVNNGTSVIQSNREYDGRTRLTDSSGNLEPTVKNVYDTFDRIVNQTITDPSGYRDELTATITYKPEGQVSSVKRLGSGLTYNAANIYDNLNRLRFVTETGTNINYSQEFTYDNNSNLKTHRNRRNAITSRDYNELNFVVTEKVGELVVMNVPDPTNNIDRLGNVKKYTDLFGKTITQEFDGANRITKRIYSDCRDNSAACEETFEYDGSDNVIRKTDKNGKATIVAYDKLNRPFDVTNPLGYVTEYRYNDAARTVTVTDAVRGLTRTIVQDALNRPTEENIQFGSTVYSTKYEYDGLTTTITDPRGTTTTRKLSTFGDVGESKTAPRGSETLDQTHLVQTRYYASGAPKQMIDALGRKTDYQIDGLNRVRGATYPKPAHLTGSVTESWAYDGEGLLTAHTDKRGVQTETSYDLLGRRDTVKVNNNGLVTVLDVDYLDAQAKETRKDANNHTTTLVYDGLHRVKQLTNADGKIKNFVYDGENLRQESDFKAEPKFTRYEYDALDRVEKVYDRAGKLTQVVYADGSTSTKTVTDRRGNKVIETYDALGRLTQVESGGMLLAKYEYDAGNNRTAEVDGESNRSEFVFNNLNRLVTAKRGASGGGFLQTESYAYDANGNLKVYSDGRGGSVSQSFDELDHLLDRKDGENNKTSYKHDGEGLLTEIIEPCGNGGASCDAGAYKTVYGYNAFGSIKNITDAKGGAWAFDYYADGKLLKEATDATGLAARKVSYVYDNLDRLKTVKQPLVPASVYDYDENSNVISVTDPKGQIQQIVPDALDRVETHSYKSAGGAELLRYKYTYDSEDNVKQIDETLSIGSAAQTFTDKRDYDQRNRLIWAVDKFGHRVEFGYDKSDNIASITDKKSESSPTASTTAYIYDALNRVKTVTLPNAETVSYAWHSDGLLERANYASGMKREYGYDNADRVTSIKNTVNAAEVQEFIYGYDGNSNRKSETKKLNGTTYRTFGYKYDELNRLSEAKDTTPAPATQPAPNQQVTVNETSAIKTFEYDSVGNREKEHTKSQSTPVTRTANSQGEVTESRGTPGEETLIGTAAASFDQLNRLIKLTEADGTIKDLSYDSNGNLLETKQNGVVQQIFEYDPRNQLRKVLSAANTEIVRFDYDVERRRVEKTVNNGSATKPERYVYAADKVIAEYKGATQYETEQARFQIGAAETVRGEFFNPLGNQQSEGARYYFSDALGSTTALAGQVGNDWKATSRYDYDSWGVQSNTNNSNNTIGYTGQRLDSETGLMALGNGERYYSPTLARFIQQDSFSGSLNLPQSLNRFSYSYNNPLKFVDPSGNAPAYIEADRKFLNRERQQASEWFNNQRENSGFLGRVGITLLETGYGAMRSFTEGSKELIFTIGDLGTKPIYDALGTPQGDRVYSSQLIEAERQDILDGTNQASARGKTIGKALLSPLTIPYNAFYENPRALNSGEISLSEYNMRQGGLLFDAVMLYVGAKAGGAKATVATESRVGLGTRLQNLKSGLSEGWQATKNFARNLKSEATAEWNRFLTEERGSIILREGKPQPKARFIVGEEGRTVDLQSVANPNEINFTQRTVSGNVENYVQDMKAGNWDWTKSSPIRVMEVNGRLVSYDNRRLMAARLAGLKEIPIIKIDPQSIMPGSKSSWASKFKSRRLDQRNIEAGGIVPEEGLSELPKVVTGK